MNKTKQKVKTGSFLAASLGHKVGISAEKPQDLKRSPFLWQRVAHPARFSKQQSRTQRREGNVVHPLVLKASFFFI